MKNRFASLLLPMIAAVAAPPLLLPSTALACGGGVTEEGATIEVDQHLAFYSVRDSGVTEVVVQLALPAPGTDFGILLPVTGEPVLDDQAIEPSELAELEAQTTPRLITDDSGADSGSSSGCGCGDDDLAGGGELNGGGGGDGGVVVQQVADIGPITAVSFAASDPDALDTWLDENGFTIPDAQRPIIASYVTEGTSFIAFKRNQAATSDVTSVGVHYTLPGDQRTNPLRMAALGAAERIGFRVYVAVPGTSGVGPADPFVHLTLDGLDRGVVSESYTEAVAQAIELRQGKAFLVEGVYRPDTQWRSWLGPRLAGLTQSDATLTRLTGIIATDTLDSDVTFSATVDAAPTEIDLTSASLGRPRPARIQWGAVGISAGALAAAIVRRLRRAIRRA